MLPDILRRTRQTLAPLTTAMPCYLGLLVAAWMTLWWSQTLSATGAGLPVLSGLLLAAVISFAVGSWTRPAAESPRSRGVTLLALTVWTALLPLVIRGLLLALGRINVIDLAGAPAEFLVGLVAGTLCLGLPHAGLGRLGDWSIGLHQQSGSRALAAPSLWGFALGMLALPTWIAPRWGFFPLAVASLVVGVFWGLIAWRGTTIESTETSDTTHPATDSRSPWIALVNACLCLTAGGVLAIVSRAVSQLWLQGLYCDFAMVAGAAAGVGWARRWTGRRALRKPAASDSSATLAGLTLALSAVGVLALFPVLIQLTLQVNARASDVEWLFAYRAGLLMLWSAPAGIAWGLATSRLSPTTTQDSGRRSFFNRGSAIMLLVTGWIIGRWQAAELIPLAWGLCAAAKLGASIGWLAADRPMPRDWRTRGLATAAGLLLVWAAASTKNFDPAVSARILFSTQAVAAADSSADRELLLAIDDARLAELTSGSESVWSAWITRGTSLLIRADGVPFGALGLNPRVAPESAAELMAAAVPLAVHPAAEHILVVGLGSGATIQTCTEFPTRSITCLEPDEDLLALAQRWSQRRPGGGLSDDRVRFLHAEPALASAARWDRTFDVVILNDRQLTGARAKGGLTVEQYQGWANRLSPGGVLCQRLEYADYGAEPIRRLVRTVSAAFPQVILWESSPGELLVLASRSTDPLVNNGLPARFEAAHVRRVMAGIGWDWTLPLSLVAVQPKDVTALAADHVPATIGDPCLAYELPVEIARWAPKSEEIRELLNPVATPVFTWLPESADVAPLKQRLADANEQRQLLARFPDHFWAYRKVLKERLQERPRSTIVPVKYEGIQHEMHPEDVRRQRYLESLGAAATQDHPDLESLRDVARFSAPFDPLVTPFIDGEIARLYARSQPRDVNAELAHWLKSTYFRPGFDRSVRDSVAALEILTSAKPLKLSPTARWDHVNALLEMLKERWNLRSQNQELSPFDPVDASAALEVSKTGIAYLRTHAVAAGIDPEWAELRCRVLDRTLVRRLRSFQSQQAGRLQRLEQREASQNQSNIPDEATSSAAEDVGIPVIP
jgi:hypothetical protein